MTYFLRSRLPLVILLGLLINNGFSASIKAAPDGGALAADKAYSAAFAKADQATLSKILDPEFTWTDRTGKTHPKAEILPVLASLAADPDAEIQTMDAGQVVLIHGSHRIPSQNVSVRFVRVWVKRQQGWQLLVYQETIKAEKTPEKRSGFGSPSDGGPISCENPCNTVPYKPEAPAEKEVVRMWQDVEKTVLANDVEAWAPNFTEDFLFVTPDGGVPLNKADRVTMITNLRKNKTTLIPAEVVSMKVWVLGDAAVMRSEHKPKHGRLLHVTRLLEKHNGHWQIAFGQQTAVEEAH